MARQWRGGRGAESETLDDGGENRADLQSRIEVLLSGSGSASPSPAVNQWLASSRQAGTTAPTAAPAPAAPEAPAAPVVPAAPAPAPGPSSRTTQFRVMPRPPKRDPNLPPRVITNAELDAARSALVFVDAQAVRSSSTPDEPEDKEMAAFQSMLTEYLKRKCHLCQAVKLTSSGGSRSYQAPASGSG